MVALSGIQNEKIDRIMSQRKRQSEQINFCVPSRNNCSSVKIVKGRGGNVMFRLRFQEFKVDKDFLQSNLI